MIQRTGNSDPRVVDAIKEAVDLDAKGETRLAAQVLAGVASEFPQASSVHGYLAWYLSKSGRPVEAMEHARQAVELSPNSERASRVLFHVLWRDGRQDQAIEEIKRFLGVRESDDYASILKKWEAGEKAADGTKDSDPLK